MHLVIVDTAQIQPYVFGSNRLRENIGASHLVAQATEAWALEAVRTVTTRSNVNDNGTLDRAKHIEDTAAALDAEVLYAGGGNFVVLFQTAENANAFTRKLSCKALTDAPNLQLVIVQQPFEWGNSLYGTVKATFKKLAEEKRARSPSAPLLGLGVTVMCQSTGLPAMGMTSPINNDPTSVYPASAEILVKREAVRAANQRLRQTFASVLDNKFNFPEDFDEMGRSEGEYSYIAIVHADGNGMGKRIQEIGDRYPNAEQKRDHINALRQFSCAVKEAAQAALQTTLAKLVARLKQDGGDRLLHKNAFGKMLTEIYLKPTGGGRHFLPFRPIVFGGDDVTFVCDGRLGLSLAIEYLRQFEDETKKRPDCNGKITACAGIAIIKTHYPFARAYALVDGLCTSAKKYRRKQDLEGSCLDWHFALSGLAGDIDEIREREYKVTEGSLTLRPMTLKENPKESQRAWDVVRKGITEFQGEGWSGRRNKVKALRDALRDGGESVKRFLIKFNETKPLPDVCPSLTNWKDEGWQGSYCGYFDAIELVDWFIPLEGGEGHDAATSSETQE